MGEEDIKEVCRQMLEEAKLMYKFSPESRENSLYDYTTLPIKSEIKTESDIKIECNPLESEMESSGSELRSYRVVSFYVYI